MKKIILMLLCITMLVSVASCNRNGENNKTKQNIETTNDISNSDSENNDDSTVKNDLSVTDENGKTRSIDEYLGTWYEDIYPPNTFKIISDPNGKLEGEMGIYRISTFYLNINIQTEKISFTDKYNWISGTIELKDNGVVVTITESNFEYISSGASWLFSIKAEENFA